MNRGFRYYVLDLITVSSEEKSVDPILYRFDCDFLYYPLEITAVSTSGEIYSTVNLFLIAKGQADGAVLSEMNLALRSGFTRYLELNNQQLYEVNPELSNLFQGDPLVMNVFYHGSLKNLYGDIMIQENDLYVPTVLEMFSQRVQDTFFYSFLELSIGEFRWLPIQGKIMAIILVLSLMAGIPTTFYLTAKLVRRAVGKTSLKMLTQKLISYSLAIIIIAFLIFANIEAVALASIVAFTFIGFAAITHQTLNFVRKL